MNYFLFSDCKRPLGLEDGTIFDGQITASSEHNQPEDVYNCCDSRFARLNSDGIWIPDIKESHHWIRINLVANYTVTGIVVQGPGPLAQNWVMTCKVKYEEMAGSGPLVYIMDTGRTDKVAIKIKFTKQTHLNEIQD